MQCFGHGEKLSRKQEEAISALLTESTVTAAASKIRVNDVTLWRWMKDQSFSEAYRQARREAISQAVAQLQHSTGIAIRTLIELMQDAYAKDTAKVTAAKTVLEFAFRGIELEDLEARLTALEQAQGES